MLRRLSAAGRPPQPPTADLSGLGDRAKRAAEEDRQYRDGLRRWRSAVADGMWRWDALLLRAATSAADVVALEAARLPTVALAVLRTATAP